MIDPILRVSLEVQPFAQRLFGGTTREVAFIRIEDDVLVTAQGCEVLSAEAPKQINEIEALVGRGN